MSTKVLSERTLDNKTIRKNEQGTAIEVMVAPDDNLLQVTDEGLKVQKPVTVKLMSLGGKDIGEVIINQ